MISSKTRTATRRACSLFIPVLAQQNNQSTLWARTLPSGSTFQFSAVARSHVLCGIESTSFLASSVDFFKYISMPPSATSMSVDGIQLKPSCPVSHSDDLSACAHDDVTVQVFRIACQCCSVYSTSKHCARSGIEVED